MRSFRQMEVVPTGTVGAEVKAVDLAAAGAAQVDAIVDVSSEDEFDRTFALMVRGGVSTVILLPDPAFVELRLPIAQLALKHHLRLIATSRVNVEAGALLSYGQDYADYFRRTPIYVDKILKGAKPADLPIEQPNIFELIVNRKTANTLGLTIPNELLLRANMVIE